jgi:hypothetical protein
VGQNAGFGVVTAPAPAAEGGQASLSGEFVVSARLGATAESGFGVLPLGSLSGGGGVTTFGPDGDYLVLGAGGPYTLDEDPALDAKAGIFSVLGDEAPTDVRYANTRIAALAGFASVPDDATRAPLGGDFTGGFAASHVQSWRPAASPGARLSEPYPVSTAGPGDVRFALDLVANGGAAEFANLSGTDSGGVGVSGLQLNWGGGDGRDVLATDSFFALRNASGVGGVVTGQPFRASGDPLSAPVGSGADARQTGFTGALATADLVGNGGIFPVGVDAEPEYLRWGWWAGEVRRDAAVSDPLDAGRVDRASLGTWIAGVQADIASVRASTGVGSYDGFAIGHVVEQTPGGPAAYVEGGSFSMQYNFGTRAGVATLSGIAGQTLTASVTEAGAVAGGHFGGDLGGFNGPGVGSINGAFFSNGTDPTAAAAGAFDFTAQTGSGTPAAVTGIFGADRTGPLTP